jgi:hypothetical protein
MKRLLLILLLLPTLAFAQNSTDGGKVPLQGIQIGGIGADGKFHFALTDNTGILSVAVVSGGTITEITDPHIVAAPGATPSPSPAEAIIVQGIAGGTAVSTSDATTATTVKSTALEASHVLKASAGKLASLQVFNSSASAQYILVMDSTTVPANGAVTLLCPPIYIAAGTYIMIPFPIPLSAANGISVSNSSTGSFTKTIGAADCAFTAQVL